MGILGLSAAFALALAAARTKIVSVTVGVEGIGILGLLTTSLVLGTALLGLGSNVSGIQHIAAAGDSDSHGVSVSVEAVRRGTTRLAVLALPVMLLAVGLAFATVGLAGSVMPWLALCAAVPLSIALNGHLAVLNGQRQLDLVANATAAGAALSTLLTAAASALLPGTAVTTAIAAPPACALILASRYTRRIAQRRRWSELQPHFRQVLLSGGAVTLGLLAASASQLLVRFWLTKEAGLETVGLVQAAWVIGNTYLGFALSAFAAEYLPRVSILAKSTERLVAAIDDQIRLTLMLSLPAILLLQIAAPVIIPILFSPEFAPSTDVLRAQLPGDVFKIFGWAIAFALLARKDRAGYLLIEATWAVSYAALAIILWPLGLKGLGAAYAGAYAIYSAVAILRMRATIAMALSKRTYVLVIVALSATTVLSNVLVDFPSVITSILVGIGAVMLAIAVAAWTHVRRFSWTKERS